jgi:predicted transcriptional regulator
VGIERQLSLKRVISKREGQKSLLPRAQETGAMGEEAIDRILKECGLRQSEVEVYVFLTKHGTLKSRDIAKQLRKDKAQVLRVLKTLQSRGIVEPTLECR